MFMKCLQKYADTQNMLTQTHQGKESKEIQHVTNLLLLRAGVLHRSPEKWCWFGRTEGGCLFDVISHGRIGGEGAGDADV